MKPDIVRFNNRIVVFFERVECTIEEDSVIDDVVIRVRPLGDTETWERPMIASIYVSKDEFAAALQRAWDGKI